MKYPLYIPLAFLLGLYFFPVQEKTKHPFIQFKSTTLSFDTVKAAVLVKGEFAFKNTGDEPLIITTVQAADGGTVADWPKSPIAAGEEAVMAVRLTTQGRSGFQDKLFNVISNAENDAVMLHFNGYIMSN